MRFALVWIALCVACGGDDDVDMPDAAPPVLFEEISAAAGIPGAVVPVDPDDDPCAVLGEGCYTDTPSFGVGAAAGDVDGDGRVDLFLGGPAGGALLRNDTAPGGEVSFAAGASPNATDYVHGVAFGDLDGDGDEDLLLGTAAGLRVYENDGAGGFSDVTGGLGVTVPDARTLSIAVADVNGDGRLDLHACDYGIPGAGSPTAGPGLMLINDGGFAFHDVASGWPGRHDWASAFADLDADGRLDLIIASETWLDDDPGEQPASIYYNDGNDGGGDPILVESAQFREQIARFSTPMAVSLGDPDADGQLELLVSVIGPLVYVDRTGPREWAASSFFGPGVDEAFTTAWSSALDDFDADGHVEALVVNGAPCTPDRCDPLMPLSQPIRLLRYAGDQFDYNGERPIPNAGGLAPDGDGYRNGRGLVRADFDGDGRDEILVTPFNDAFRLYRRIDDPGNALRLLFPRTAYGAEAMVAVGGATTTRQLVSGGATHSQSEPALTFELGEAASAEVSIHWLDGSIQDLGEIPAGTAAIE